MDRRSKRMFCTHCGNQIDASGVLPLVVEYYAEGNKSWFGYGAFGATSSFTAQKNSPK